MDKDFNLRNEEFVNSLTPSDIQSMFNDVIDLDDVLMAKNLTKCATIPSFNCGGTNSV